MHIRSLKYPRIYPARPNLRVHGIEHHDCESPDFGMVRGRQSIADRSGRIWPSEIPILAGQHLYAGAIVNHFGHFIIDCAQRLWACRHFQSQVDSIVFLPLGPRLKQSSRFIAFCRFFGIDLSKATFIDSPIVVENLIIPELGYVPGRPRSGWYEDELLSIFNIARLRNPTSPKKVIISRKSYPHARVDGMDQITPSLIQSGYKEISPEDHSLRQQIEFLVSADFIIIEEGSAAHLLDIMPKIEVRCALLKRRGAHHIDDTILDRTDGTVIPVDDHASVMHHLGDAGFLQVSAARWPKVLG